MMPAPGGRSVLAHSREVLAESAALAEAVAATEEQVAATLDQAIENLPDRAEDLRALSVRAWRHAAYARRLAKECSQRLGGGC